MPFISVPERESTVHYEVEGDGPALVLVHGTGGDAVKTFGNVVGGFGGRTIIRPNLSGSGQTTDSGADLTIGLLADQVAAATREAADDPVDLDIRHLLPKIEAPTLVIGLTDDQAIPVAGSRQLHAGIRESDLVEIPGGHMDWLVQPDPVVKLARKFFAQSDDR